MSWADYPDRQLAERVCTQKELDVLRLTAAEYGQRRAARILGISRDTLRHRLDNARRKIRNAKETAA
jgi:predicted DNA-binding protein (UPF0251 family)